jgi:hypothetical protein
LPFIELKFQCLVDIFTHWVPPTSPYDEAKRGAFEAILPQKDAYASSLIWEMRDININKIEAKPFP